MPCLCAALCGKILFFSRLCMQGIHSLPLLAPNIHPSSTKPRTKSLLNSVRPHNCCQRAAAVVVDALIRQMRTRSRAGGRSKPEGDQDDVNSVLAMRRTRLSIEEINKGWFQGQYSKQMSGSNRNHTPGGDDEIVIAIAAAAYAVNSLDELDQRAMMARGDSFPTRAKGKKDMITQQEPYDPSKPLSGQQDPSLLSKGIHDSKEHKLEPKPSNVGDGPVKTVQKRPTLAEKLVLDRTERGKPKQLLQEEEDLPMPLQKPKKRTASSSTMNTAALPPPLPPLKFPATMPGDPPLFEIQSQATAEPTATRLPAAPLANRQPKRQIEVGGGASEADAWERGEMARIRAKYEKLSQTIVTWEDDKKKAARRKLDKNEREIEGRRAKVQKEYRKEMERIGQMAGGARAQAEERRRNEELKTRGQGERIRRTGKARSNACFCF